MTDVTARSAAAPGAARGVVDAWTGFSVRLAGEAARRAAARHVRLSRHLEAAHLPYLPEAYVAVTWTTAGAVALSVGILLAAGVALATAAGAGVSAPILAVLALIPFAAAGMVYFAITGYPSFRAAERKRNIDLHLPYAANYVAAMSSAGVVPAEIFRDLARQPAYGEASRDLAWLSRDIDLFGIDLVSAMDRSIARSPSERMQEFLQGAKTTVLSGGDLQSYFSAKSEQYMRDSRAGHRKFLARLGVLAEAYITVAVAGPLFLLVLLSVMLIIGRGSESVEAFLFALIFFILPIAHASFSWVVKNLTPEG